MTNDELRTRITRAYGLSPEDADTVIDLVATETMTRYLQRPDVVPVQEHIANPTFMQTTIGTGDQAITRAWVSVEAIAEQVAPQVTEMVAKALTEAAERRLGAQ